MTTIDWKTISRVYMPFVTVPAIFFSESTLGARVVFSAGWMP